MELHDVLAPRRQAIVGGWLDALAAAWPSPAASLLANRDPFRNPVGRVMREAADAAFDVLTSPAFPTALPPACAELVALRAVQPDCGLHPARGLTDTLAALMRGVLAEGSAAAAEHARLLRELDDRTAAFAALASAEHERCRARIEAIRHREAAGHIRPDARAGRRLEPTGHAGSRANTTR